MCAIREFLHFFTLSISVLRRAQDGELVEPLFCTKRVKDGIRTRDPWNHNPMLYPTELLSPLRFPPYRIQLKNESAKCKIEEVIAAKRQFHIFDT